MNNGNKHGKARRAIPGDELVSMSSELLAFAENTKGWTDYDKLCLAFLQAAANIHVWKTISHEPGECPACTDNVSEAQAEKYMNMVADRTQQLIDVLDGRVVTRPKKRS